MACTQAHAAWPAAGQSELVTAVVARDVVLITGQGLAAENGVAMGRKYDGTGNFGTKNLRPAPGFAKIHQTLRYCHQWPDKQAAYSVFRGMNFLP